MAYRWPTPMTIPTLSRSMTPMRTASRSRRKRRKRRMRTPPGKTQWRSMCDKAAKIRKDSWARDERKERKDRRKRKRGKKGQTEKKEWYGNQNQRSVILLHVLINFTASVPCLLLRHVFVLVDFLALGGRLAVFRTTTVFGRTAIVFGRTAVDVGGLRVF